MGSRAGDRGRTRLAGGQWVPKDDVRVEALGDLDELMCALGLAFCHTKSRRQRHELRQLQGVLLRVGERVAGLRRAGAPGKDFFGDERNRLDDKCASLRASIRAPKAFVFPGAGLASTHLDAARAVARRCERRLVALARRKLVNDPDLLAWFNRLSEYLWLLARACERRR